MANNCPLCRDWGCEFCEVFGRIFGGNESRICTNGRRKIGQSSREPMVSEIPSSFFDMATVLPSSDLIVKRGSIGYVRSIASSRA